MPLSREQKQEILNKLEDGLKKSNSAVFVNFSKISVDKLKNLRKSFREKNIYFMVAKKTLINIILKKLGLNINLKEAEGSNALAFGYEDEVATAKILYGFSKEKNNDGFKIVGGILDGSIISQEEVLRLAKLPTKEELYQKVASSIASPISGFVNVLQGNIRNLIFVLNTISQK